MKKNHAKFEVLGIPESHKKLWKILSIKILQKNIFNYLTNFEPSFRCEMADDLGLARRVGPCCLGADCKNPTHKLRAAHKCAFCDGILHVLCGVENFVLESLVCPGCNDVATESSLYGDNGTPMPPPPTKENNSATNATYSVEVLR